MSDSEDDTTELDERYTETVTVHGRAFQEHSIENDIYLVPIDEQEEVRLRQQHLVFNEIFDDKLIFPPLDYPHKVLDCGYGAGCWAVDVAEMYEDSEVTGVDINPLLKPTDTPENFWPQLDDLNEPFTFKAKEFDLVHSRMVCGGINASRWPSYVRDIWKVLKPGGWVQMVECYFMAQSDNGSITDNHSLRKWSNKYLSAMQGLKDVRVPLRLKDLCRAAGFVDIEQKMIQMPLCDWSSDIRQKRIGAQNKDNVRPTLTSLGLLPFTKRLGMTLEEFTDVMLKAAIEASTPSLKAYFPIYVCIARKPA